MEDKLEIRQLTTMKELYLAQEVEEKVWQVPPIPVHQTYTAILNGGVAIGAFIGEQLIGFQYSFPGFDGKRAFLCSHMLGILPEYRKAGIGVKLKLKQAEVAKTLGYDMMTWTFDPLESVNANLNLNKLGAVGVFYSKDHYGGISDGLNKGMPTDRIIIEWSLNNKQEQSPIVFDPSKLLVAMDDEKQPILTDVFHHQFSANQLNWFVAIPENIQKLKRENLELAIDWRYKTRDVFQTLYDNGYKATQLIRSSGVSYYTFIK